MKTLELNQMENIQGYGWFDDACTGFGLGIVALEAGAYLMLWNPVGQVATGAILAVTAICLLA